MSPRYVFVRMNQSGKVISAVRNTSGVSTLLRFGPVLACLCSDKREALRSLIDAQSAVLPDHRSRAGAAVIFNAGPLTSADGIISSVAAERVQVMMNLLGQEHKVFVGVNEISCG